MGKIISLQTRFQKTPDNVISLKPWEFRKPAWEAPHFIQMLRTQSLKLECQRHDIRKKEGKGTWHLPSHFPLKGSMVYTIRAMYANRKNENKMRDIYYLTGLLDCIINQVNPILRTSILNAMYKKISEMKEELNVYWYGPFDQVLLPIESQFYNEFEYRSSVQKAKTLKELYQVIRNETDLMFDMLSLRYVFYCPRVRG